MKCVVVAVLLVAFSLALACQNNYEFNPDRDPNEWYENGLWKTDVYIKLKYQLQLKDWTLRLDFYDPLARSIGGSNIKGKLGTAKQTVVNLSPKNDRYLHKGVAIWYRVFFTNKQLPRGHLKCAQFCGIRTDTGAQICDGDVLITTSGKPETTATTKTTGNTQPNSPISIKPTSTISTREATGNCLDNYVYQTRSKWRQGVSLYKINGVINPRFNYQLDNWYIKIEFWQPLAESIEIYNSVSTSETKGQTKITLTAKEYNKILDPSKEHSYIASFKSEPGSGSQHLVCVQFCGTRIDTGEKLCDVSVVITTTLQATTTPTESSTTTTAGTTQTTPSATSSSATPSVTAITTVSTTTDTKITTQNPEACTPKYNYGEVLEKSLRFYEAQRSGKLPADQRVKWRGDSALNDGQDKNIDLSGGYYDAGDHVKFGFPMAATITNLAWGMLEFKKGYTSSGQYENGLKAIKWGTDYFIKCHPSENKFYGQVGLGQTDHVYWGPPENMNMNRPSNFIDQSKPGSELAGETAAALAASSLVFKDEDSTYASELLSHAKQLYSFAMKYFGDYHNSIPDAANFYRSWSGYKDELAWACLWLYRATGDEIYKTDFLKEFDNDAFSQSPGEFSWDNKWHGVQVLAQQLKISNKDYLGKLKYMLQQPKKTPKGLFFVQPWGTLRHAANLAFLARVASTMADKDFYNDFARSQINYMLGDTGRSYVVGFGTNPPLRPHHRSSSCPYIGNVCEPADSTNPSPKVLNGALVGGPDANDFYEDKRNDYIKNEVACDYNAGFQSTIAGLIQLSEEGQC